MIMGTMLDFEQLTLKKKLKKLLRKTKYKNVAYHDMKDFKYIEKSTLCKGRKKIKSMAIKILNNDWISNSYTLTNSKPDFVLYKNKYILACNDGTTLEIENTKENRKKFGCTKSKEGYKELARAGASMLYDPINKKIIDVEIGKYPTEERKFFKKHIKNAKKLLPLGKDIKLLVISDRGYFSIDLLTYCIENDASFMFRLPSTSLAKECKEMASNDEYIEIDLLERYKNNIHDKEKVSKFKKRIKKLEKSKVTVRLTKVILDTGEIEYLLSNIPKEEVSYEEMKELYFKRWGIETTYDLLKNTLNLEKFSGISKDIITQEFYAHALLSNIAYDLELEAQEIINERNKTKQLKWKYQVNRNEMIGTMSEYFLDLLYEEDDMVRDKIFDNVMEEISRSVEAIRPNRSFKRNKVNKGGNKNNRNRNR